MPFRNTLITGTTRSSLTLITDIKLRSRRGSVWNNLVVVLQKRLTTTGAATSKNNERITLLDER